MAKTFTWRLERSPTPTINYRTITAQFGDGYKQVSADGINTKDESYAVKLTVNEKVAEDVMAFFDEHRGIKSFLWKPPLGKMSFFTCIDPNPVSIGGGFYTITATFVKSFSNSPGVVV